MRLLAVRPSWRCKMALKLRKSPKFDTKLDGYPYQLDAVRAVKSLPYAAIFHEQGLGKTKIAIDLALFWLEEDIVDTMFIVTKKMLLQNWLDEFMMHSHVTPKILSDNRRENSLALNSPILIYIMNYEVVSANLNFIRLFLDTCRVGVILDESQKIKNPEAKLTMDFHSIANNFTRRIIMTGTPVANRPYDIWSQIKFLDSGKSLGESFTQFKREVDLPKNLTDEIEYADQLAGIFKKLQGFSVRETKKTAKLTLPDKTILTHFVELEPSQRIIYESYRERLAHEFEGINGIVIDSAEDILKRLLRLVQCASNPALIDKTYKGLPGKYTELLKQLQKIGLQSRKVVIWTGFVDGVEWLSDKLQSFSPQKVHGKMSVAERNEAIKHFKEKPECKILLTTPGAAKEGLTLTVSNHTIFYDRSFSLDDYLQAQDRIHRISQKDDCFVHNLIARDTIDEWIDILLNAKHQAAQLAQGDISRTEFRGLFKDNLSEALARILGNI